MVTAMVRTAGAAVEVGLPSLILLEGGHRSSIIDNRRYTLEMNWHLSTASRVM